MPKAKLTERVLAALKLKGERVELWDEGCPGLVLRASSHRLAWTVTYRIKGTDSRPRLTLGTFPDVSLYSARQQAMAAIDMAKRGIDPAADAPAPESVPLGEVIEKFRERAFRDLAVSTQKEWGRLFHVEIVPTLANLDASQVREARRRIRELTDTIVARGARYTANRVWEVVRRIVGWGVSQDLLAPEASAVFANFERPALEKKRDRVLNHEEIRKVLAAVEQEPPITATFWRLLFLTGQRRGEVLAARWEDLDLDRARWTLRVKGGKTHTLPLPSQAVEALEAVWPISGRTPFVCSGTAIRGHLWNPQKTVARVRAASGVTFRVHDVRRTVASGLAELKVEQRLISLILSHTLSDSNAAPITGQVYVRFAFIEEMRAALQKWADYLDGVAVAKAADVVPLRQGTPASRPKRARAVGQ
jgi:integrase